MNQKNQVWKGMVQHLNEGGCPVRADHGYRFGTKALAIEPIGGFTVSQIFTLEQGGTGFALEFVLRNELQRPIDVTGFQIKTPWGIQRLSLLPAPRKSSARWPHYCFPEPGPYYDGDYVLNPLFDRRKSRLNPGEEREGVLVASSEEEIPSSVRHRDGIFVTLRIFDSRRTAFSARFGVRVIRDDVAASQQRELVKKLQISKAAEEVELRKCSLIAPPAPEPISYEKINSALMKFYRDLERRKADRNNTRATETVGVG